MSPQSTLKELAAGGPGGLVDLLLLLALQVVAVHLPRLAVAVWYMVDVSYSAGVSLLLNTIAESVVMQVVAVFLATGVMGWFTRGQPGRERNLDLAALCMVPANFLQLVVSLVMGVARVQSPRWLALTVLGAGAGWFCILVLYSLRLMRRRPAETENSKEA